MYGIGHCLEQIKTILCCNIDECGIQCATNKKYQK